MDEFIFLLLLIGMLLLRLITDISCLLPEVLLCMNYGPSIDVYSFAILAWEVFSGKEPFSGLSMDKHFEQVIIHEKRPKRLGSVPKPLQKLVEESWHKYPFNRPTFRDICSELGGLLTGTKNAKYISDRTTFLTNQSLRSRAESFAGSVAGDSSDKSLRASSQSSVKATS